MLPHQPFDPVAPSMSAGVPMLIGAVLNEQTHAINHPEYENMTDAECRRRVNGRYPEKAPPHGTPTAARIPKRSRST